MPNRDFTRASRLRAATGAILLALWAAATATAQSPAFELQQRAPYDVTPIGGGWTLGQARRPSALPPIDRGMTLEVDRVKETITIDGRLSERVWNAPGLRVESLRYFDSRDLEPGRAQTIVQFAFDDTALYVAVRCFDARIPKPRETPERTRELLEDDEIVLMIDPEADLGNPASMRYFRLPALRPRDPELGDFMPGQPRQWRHESAVSEGVWTSEARLDWWGLEPTPNFRQTWIVNVVRVRNAASPRPWTPFEPVEREVVGIRLPGVDPHTRNSAWAPVLASDRDAKAAMPRLHLNFDFSPFLWEVRDLWSETKERSSLHNCSLRLVNRASTSQSPVIEATGHSARWSQASASKSLTFLGGQERHLDFIYPQDAPGPHDLSITIRDPRRGRVLRRSRLYHIEPTRPLAELKLRVAQGERGHVAFAMRALRDLEDVSVTSSDLFSGKALLFAKWLSIRSLEPVLENSGWRIDTEGRRAFIPHGEIQPDRLVVRDAPFPMAENDGRLFWISLERRDLGPGLYKGTVTIAADGAESVEVPLTIEVTPRAMDANLRPYLGLWGLRTDDQPVSRDVRELDHLGFTSVWRPIALEDNENCAWGPAEQDFVSVAVDEDVEALLAPPLRALVFEPARDSLKRLLVAERRRERGADISILMPRKPYGEGLYPSYGFLRRECPWVRIGLVVSNIDTGMRDAERLVDDWFLAIDATEDPRRPDTLAQMRESARWRALLEGDRDGRRFVALHTPSNHKTAGQTALDLRAACWSAWRERLDGVAVRPAAMRWSHSAAGALPDSGPRWIELRSDDHAPGVSRRLEALADGAEDWALLTDFREEIDTWRSGKRKWWFHRRFLRELRKTLDIRLDNAREQASTDAAEALRDLIFQTDFRKRTFPPAPEPAPRDELDLLDVIE